MLSEDTIIGVEGVGPLNNIPCSAWWFRTYGFSGPRKLLHRFQVGARAAGTHKC